MLEKPAIEDDTILACLRENYGVTVSALDFLPIGYDANAGVYRVGAGDRRDYFLKVKRGDVCEASLAIPRFLKDRGIEQVVAPIVTRSQRLWASADPFALILYPFIEGRTAMEVGLSDSQWIEFGAVLRQMHAASLPPDLGRQVQRETFTPVASGLVMALDARIGGGDFDDTYQREWAAIWREEREVIRQVVDRAEALGRSLQTRFLEFVLCHADIHTANILVDPAGRFFIVDWDGAMLAPKERDLMFITGVGAGGSVAFGNRAQDLFFTGYGEVEIDPTALAYYRYDWVVQDIGEFGRSVFLTADAGDETKADAVRIFRALFQPGETVEAAYSSV